MQKGERLDITVSVIATEDMPETVAMDAAHQAVKAAVEVLTSIPAKRFISTTGISARLKRRVMRRRVRPDDNPVDPGSGLLH